MQTSSLIWHSIVKIIAHKFRHKGLCCFSRGSRAGEGGGGGGGGGWPSPAVSWNQLASPASRNQPAAHRSSHLSGFSCQYKRVVNANLIAPRLWRQSNTAITPQMVDKGLKVHIQQSGNAEWALKPQIPLKSNL